MLSKQFKVALASICMLYSSTSYRAAWAKLKVSQPSSLPHKAGCTHLNLGAGWTPALPDEIMCKEISESGMR